MANKAGVPGALRRVVMREAGYRCAQCLRKGSEQRFPRGGFGFPTDESGIYLSIDHIVPRVKGGSSNRDNIRVLCTQCNTRKGVKDA